MRINPDTVAVITGAASGLGRALAQHMADKGASLALADVNESGLQETARLAQRRTITCTTHLVDVSDEPCVRNFVQAVVDAHGRANLVVNNAGVALHGRVEELSTNDIAWLMNVNFWGVVYGTKYFLPLLRQQAAAHVVNVSSIFGIIGFPGQAAYNASKFAVRGFTEALRHELEGTDVRVSCVHPGGTKTNIARNARPGTEFDPNRIAHEISIFDKLSPATAERAAVRILRGILRDEPRIVVGTDAAITIASSVCFPSAIGAFCALARMARPTVTEAELMADVLESRFGSHVMVVFSGTVPVLGTQPRRYRVAGWETLRFVDSQEEVQAVQRATGDVFLGGAGNEF